MEAKSRPKQTADKFMVRLDDGMRDELKAIAAKNRRSMNAEINIRLTASLAAEKEKVSK